LLSDLAPVQFQLKPLDESGCSCPDRSLHHLTLDPEREYEHRVLKERTDLAPERLAPVMLAYRHRSSRRTGNPARRAAPVIEVVSSENRLEHSFLVAHDQLVLDSE